MMATHSFLAQQVVLNSVQCTQFSMGVLGAIIISFLEQLQHNLLPSLLVTSSQIRVIMPLSLLSCCISGLGPEGLQHNRTIPVWSPSTT
jgi:hypothetical protein